MQFKNVWFRNTSYYVWIINSIPKYDINSKIRECNKTISIVKQLSLSVSRSILMTINKSSVRPHLEYCDKIYSQPQDDPFQEKIEKVQRNACLAITGEIQVVNAFTIN